MNGIDKRRLVRIVVALVLFLLAEFIVHVGFLGSDGNLWVQLVCFAVPYCIAGFDVLFKAARGIVKGQVFDENFLMAIASLGAFALVLFPDADPHMAEGAAVMIFYQVGELFQDYAVGKSRQSIADMMDIAPEYANLLHDGATVQVDPCDVRIGDEIVIKPGERIPLDGVVVNGSSQVDTAALTGEPVAHTVACGAEVVSGCVNLTGVLTVRVAKEYGESTVQRILELVEEASERKARTENFITRFARYYTPIVVCCAVALALVPPLLFGQSWAECAQSALVFLVVSCPCALVISVPLSFFGGIGAASRVGILVKGSSYLEALGSVDTVVFDKTGTLTRGSFDVVGLYPCEGAGEEDLLRYAAHAEAFSDHPIAVSVRAAYGAQPDQAQVEAVEELAGKGVAVRFEGHELLVGNEKLMAEQSVAIEANDQAGTVLYVAIDDVCIGNIVLADIVKDDAEATITGLHGAGVSKTVMLTGDREEVAAAVAGQLGIDEFHAQLMPQDKVACVEKLLAAQDAKSKLAFVGDGINDAPVLMRADVGIAMGALGSDAAIEAADIVLMDDKPSNIALSIKIARKTMRIVWENIMFALGVKIAIMILALPFIGIATMWLAVFGDVGVACLAVLNAMRALHVKK